MGGAVAVPYKEKFFNLIKNNVPQGIKDIGAVNCFYRQPLGLQSVSSQVRMRMVSCFRAYIGVLEKNENLSIALLGLGGAGKAILSFLLRDFKKTPNPNI